MGNTPHQCNYTNIKRNDPSTNEPSGLHIDRVDLDIKQADFDNAQIEKFPPTDKSVKPFHVNSWFEESPLTDRIYVKTFHLGCKSDKDWDEGEFGGIIIYSMGSLKPKTDVRINPGYVFIKNGRWLKSKKTFLDEGMIHGVLCRILTGWQPTTIAKCGGSISGFSINDGVVRINSNSCNANRFGIYNTSGNKSHRSMNEVEEKTLKSAISWWKRGGGQNYYV